jgi:DNA-binding XRE family transcriptional regulator
MTAKKIGEALRSRRTQLSLCQGAAGDKARPPLLRKTVADIENATGNPLLSSVIAYAAALGLRLDVGATQAPLAKHTGIRHRKRPGTTPPGPR